jgi:integrase
MSLPVPFVAAAPAAPAPAPRPGGRPPIVLVGAARLPVVPPTDPRALVATAFLELARARSRRTYHQALARAARLLTHQADPARVPWAALDAPLVAQVRTTLLDGGARPRTVRATLTALRGVAKVARLARLMPGEVERDIREVPLPRLDEDDEETRPGRALGEGELSRLFAGIAGTRPLDHRDRALLAVACFGLRRAELAGLERAGWCERVVNRAPEWGVEFTGKGGRRRFVPLYGDYRTAMILWLEARDALAEAAGLGPLDGPLWLAFARDGRTVRRRPRAAMSIETVRAVLARLRARAPGRDPLAPFTPHDLRRTTASLLLDRDVPLADVQQLLGHSDPKTTAAYRRDAGRGKARAAREVAALHVRVGV